jgi:alcohol dehydrogenase YqhD (iron-dependent ADH family)
MKLHFENGYFGIKKDGLTIVPFEHETVKSAVDEWVHFETLNIKEQFLDYTLTEDEIKMVANKLLGDQFNIQREAIADKLKDLPISELRAIIEESRARQETSKGDDWTNWESLRSVAFNIIRSKMDGFLNAL